jgi:hypothetical protein
MKISHDNVSHFADILEPINIRSWVNNFLNFLNDLDLDFFKSNLVLSFRNKKKWIKLIWKHTLLFEKRKGILLFQIATRIATCNSKDFLIFFIFVIISCFLIFCNQNQSFHFQVIMAETRVMLQGGIWESNIM